jgi:hypothetical protein
MKEELINDRRSSYAASEAVIFEPAPNLGIIDPFARPHSSTNTIASCRDYPIPTHPSDIFKEKDSEQEYRSLMNQELQQKQKESFLKRMSPTNIKARFKDTWTSCKNYFSGKKVEKPENLPQNVPPVAKNAVVGTPVPVANTTPVAVPQVVLPPLNDIDKMHIQDIEDVMVSYAQEMQKAGGGNMNALTEMLHRIVTMLNRLGCRLNKQEMHKVLEHLEINVKNRVKTYNGQRIFTYIAVALEATAAVLSFGGLAGGFAGGKGSMIGRTFINLSKTASPLGTFGGGVKSFDDIKEQHRAGERTELEFIEGQLKNWREDKKNETSKTNQAAQESMSGIRNMNQTDTDAKKRVFN